MNSIEWKSGKALVSGVVFLVAGLLQGCGGGDHHWAWAEQSVNNHGGDWVLVWAGTALLSFVGLCIILLYLAISCCRVLDVPRRDIELGSI